MRKIISLLLTVILFSSMLVGCSGSQLSEEELREQVKAELAAEVRAEVKAELAEEAANEEKDSNSQEEVALDDETNEEKDNNEETKKLKGTGVDIKVVANVLNVRDAANTDGKIVGTVNEGEIYEIIEELVDADEDYNSWYKIQLDNYDVGWVAGWYCVEYSGGNTKVGKENLEPAFKGYLDGIDVNIGYSDSLDKVINKYGNENYSVSGSTNGDNYYYFDAGFTFEISGMTGKVRFIEVQDTYQENNGTIYGVQFGMDEQDVTDVIGEPDFTVELNGREDDYWHYDYGNLGIYVIGSYYFIVNYYESYGVVGISIAENLDDL